MSDSLKKAREIINETDAAMAKLFEQRMHAVAAVAEYKAAHGLGIYDKNRENEVIAKNAKMIEDDDLRAYYVTFLKNTMAVSRSYQETLMKGMRVAYCGMEGAFAHTAAEEAFPSSQKVAYSSFDAAYDAVSRGECTVALLPIENSFNGEVGQVTDLMFRGDLFVNNVTEHTVTQHLLALPGAKLSDIKTVISHPQALGQCHEYIEQKGFEEIEYSNTALAAKLVSEKGDKSLAAIASEEAASVFGLTILDKNINSSKNNTTRFAVFSQVAKKPSPKERGIHTILTFTVRNEAGALAKAIEVIGKHGFNMRSLRSRPMKELLWQYYFYVEAEGNVMTDDGDVMLRELNEYCDKLKVVGVFSKAQEK